jgi:DNA helicase-2/ATP-dependent DNA helicase PcrA
MGARVRFVSGEHTESSTANSHQPTVFLATFHGSKGLEWDNVFLVRMNDEVFPQQKDEESVLQERRLFYVGITRCMDELHLTYPEMRLGSGYASAFQPPSRFLRELPEHLFETPDHFQPLAGGVDSGHDDDPF